MEQLNTSRIPVSITCIYARTHVHMYMRSFVYINRETRSPLETADIRQKSDQIKNDPVSSCSSPLVHIRAMLLNFSICSPLDKEIPFGNLRPVAVDVRLAQRR